MHGPFSTDEHHCCWILTQRKEGACKSIYYYPKNSENLVGGKLIKQAWFYWNLNNGHYFTLNNGLSMEALTWHLCNKSSYQSRGFDFNMGDKSYSNPGQLQALNRWSSLDLYQGSTDSGCTNVSY